MNFSVAHPNSGKRIHQNFTKNFTPNFTAPLAEKNGEKIHFRTSACRVAALRIPGNALRAFPGSFRTSSGISSEKSQPYWGHNPLANVRLFRFLVPGEHPNVPLLRFLVLGEHPPNPPFGKPPFREPPILAFWISLLLSFCDFPCSLGREPPQMLGKESKNTPQKQARKFAKGKKQGNQTKKQGKGDQGCFIIVRADLLNKQTLPLEGVNFHRWRLQFDSE